MPGLDPQIVMHRLKINPDAKPIKQQQRWFCPEIMKAIESEVKKLINSSFVREEQYRSHSQKRMERSGLHRLPCLNVTCSKNEFPLLITPVMIDSTCDFERMSFMDDFSGYNQIKMYSEDENHTSFRTPLGVYCYTVMPFCLKNVGATYQRVMNAIFHEHIRKTV